MAYSLVKAQAQQSGPHSDRRLVLMAMAIYKDQGFKGLFRGVGPNTQRAMILTASQLPAYDYSKHLMLQHGILKEGALLHFACSMFSGFVCATTTAPVDLVKSRFMSQGYVNGKGVLYSTPFDCLIKTVKSEGFLGLFQGWFPQWIRLGPHTIVTFIVLEQLRKLLNLSPY